ncbi:MAG: SDR family NAD(P)-dependent oxidoreductase [Pseudomonadales bacterium]
MRFSEKIVLVTGGASGIGLAISHNFLAEGATVIATDINSTALESLAHEGSGTLVTRISDAGDLSAIADLAQWVEQEYGVLDVLVNNAGFAVMKNPEEVDEAEYHAQMNVLLTGPVFYVKHFAKLLRASASGSVLNISSASAVLSSTGYCPYALAKAAIVKFTEDSVIQVPGIRHNAILPGFIETSILQEAYGEDAAAQLGELCAALEPINRIGKPQDIADSVLFLASDAASYINGASLLVDGGLTRLNTAVSLVGGQVSVA